MALDALLHARVTTADDLATEALRWTGYRGIEQARGLLALADAGAASPGESLIRLACADAHLGPLRTQVPLLGGRYIGDLLVGPLTLIEFEGPHHRLFPYAGRDLRRFNDLGAVPGLQMLCFDRSDLADMRALVARVYAGTVRASAWLAAQPGPLPSLTA